ncbi:MAG: TolC family protein [Candidatus Zixiibacteriota bacterium]
MILIAVLFPAFAAAETLTLEDALRTALRGSLSAELAEVERSQGKQALAEGIVTVLPDPAASYSTSADTMGELGDTWRFNFSLNQPVVDASVFFNVVRGSRERAYYRAAADRTLAELILDVQDNYYALAEAQALALSAEGQYRRAESNLKTVTRRYEVGEANLADKLRAEADFLGAETDLLSADNGVEDNRRALSDIIGLGAWEEIEAETLPTPEDPASLPTTLVSAAALGRNPDLEVLRRQLKSSDAAYWAAWGEVLPALSFSLSRGSTVGTPGDGQDDAETRYGLNLSLPVNVHDIVLGITGARLDRRQARLELVQAELDARERLASLLATQELSYLEWEAAAKTVELNEEIYRLNKRSYELGAASFNDLLDAEAELTEAERALVQSQAEYWSSRAELNYVLGASVEE